MGKDRIDFQAMAARWHSTVVARSKVGEFTGGIYAPRTLANLDSKGTGPRDRVMVGGKIAYPIDAMIEFLENRCKAVGK